jgi:hypothetical protein
MNDQSFVPKRYGLDTITGVALAAPPKGHFRFTWTVVVSGTQKRTWYSDEEVFRIEEDVEFPLRLTMKVMDNKECYLGPFHSLAAAQEAANRIWNHMLAKGIHHSQIVGGGTVGVVSRVLFPNL